MKVIIFCTCLFLHGLTFSQQDKEEALIRETLMDYIEGTANGQPERLRRAFHPDFNLYSTTSNDDLRIWDGDDYISGVEPGRKANRIGRIVSVDHEGITATAKVEIVMPDRLVFTDYFLLVKYQGKWKIIHKSYSSRAFAEKDKIALLNNELDTLFSDFDRPDHPAVAALAIHKGEVVYQRTFGSSHLDPRTPANVDTKFQLAGMSKHFTAFAIFLLEEQGKLSLTDEIGDHLSWLPKYESPITIDHLLSTTSGLSDFWDLKNIAGWHRDDVFTQEHARELIKKIKPAFKAGTAQLYSNTDQLLLAEIVVAVSGRSFGEFMKQEVFEPLDMNHTQVADDFELLIPGVAASYESDGNGGFKNSPMNYGIYGPTNIYSSISDQAKWELNLLDPKVGSKSLIEKLYGYCTTSDGSYLDSWNGRHSYAQQFYHWGHGVKEPYQIATLGGHSTSIFKFPDQEFTVITMSSGIPYSGYLGMGLAYHFIGDQFNDPEEIDFSSLKTQKLKTKQLERYAGYYWDDTACFSRELAVTNDTLRYMRADGRSSALLPLSNNQFQMMVGEGEVVILTFEEENGTQVMNFASGDVRIAFRKAEKAAYTGSQLRAFTGRFYCASLNAVYTLELQEGMLVARNPRVGSFRLRPAMKDTFEGEGVFTSIHFNEDQSSFLLESEDVRGILFERI